MLAGALRQLRIAGVLNRRASRSSAKDPIKRDLLTTIGLGLRMKGSQDRDHHVINPKPSCTSHKVWLRSIRRFRPIVRSGGPPCWYALLILRCCILPSCILPWCRGIHEGRIPVIITWVQPSFEPPLAPTQGSNYTTSSGTTLWHYATQSLLDVSDVLHSS